MLNVAMVALAGAVGALGRYGVSTWAARVGGGVFPLGTLTVNVFGSLLIGVIMQLSLTSTAIPAAVRVPLVVGFLGAFTTFSAFSYETVRLVEGGHWRLALANAAANLVLCLIATVLGMLFGRAMLPTA